MRAVLVLLCLMARAAMADGSDEIVDLPDLEAVIAWEAPTAGCTITLTNGRPGVAVAECSCAELWDALGDQGDVAAWLMLYERACGPIRVEVLP